MTKLKVKPKSKPKLKLKPKSPSSTPPTPSDGKKKVSLKKSGNSRAKSSGASPKKDPYRYRVIDGKKAREQSRKQSQLGTFDVDDIGAGVISVTCPKSDCRKSFTIAREWLKGKLFHLRPEQTVAGAPEWIVYDTAGCPWCGSYAFRVPEGEGLSDDDFE